MKIFLCRSIKLISLTTPVKSANFFQPFPNTSSKTTFLLRRRHRIIFDSRGENFHQWLLSQIFVCEREEGSARWEETSAIQFLTVEERTFEWIWLGEWYYYPTAFYFSLEPVGGWWKWGCCWLAAAFSYFS